MREACHEKELQNIFNDVIINEVYKVRSDNPLQEQKLYKKFLCTSFKNYACSNKQLRSTM